MVDIEYPTFTSKIGIDPLLCRVDNNADNILNLEVNGNLCDKQPGHNDSCKGDNVFIKQSMINRISNKYGDTTFIRNNKNNIIAMMKHPNYSKSLCHNTLNKSSYVDKMTYSQAVLPYNYEYCDKDSPCNNYKNTIYEKTNTIPHNMVNYGSKDDKNITPLSGEIFDNQTNNNIVNNNNELCNNFYKVYCEKLNSMLKEKFGDKFDTSMLGEYENMCLCYQDLYKDYLPNRIYKGFSAPKNGDIAANVADRLEVQLSYAIGRAEPLSISISTFKTAHYPDAKILEIINKVFDCRPGAIIKNFKMRTPEFSYREISNYGHLGRPDLDLPWERLDKVEEIKELLK